MSQKPWLSTDYSMNTHEKPVLLLIKGKDHISLPLQSPVDITLVVHKI